MNFPAMMHKVKRREKYVYILHKQFSDPFVVLIFRWLMLLSKNSVTNVTVDDYCLDQLNVLDTKFSLFLLL